MEPNINKAEVVFVKVYCFEKLIEHLKAVQKSDKRKRERRRAIIAIRFLSGLVGSGIEEYEKRKRSEMDKPTIILPP